MVSNLQTDPMLVPHIDNLHQLELVESILQDCCCVGMMNESFDPIIDCHTKGNVIQRITLSYTIKGKKLFL